VLDSSREVANPLEFARPQRLVGNFGGDLSGLHRFADPFTREGKRSSDAFSQHQRVSGAEWSGTAQAATKHRAAHGRNGFRVTHDLGG
jgi:hypothetical protein